MKFLRRRLFLVVAVLVVVPSLWLFLPYPPSSYTSPKVASVPSYADAVAAWEKVIAATPASVREDCRPQMLLHGQPTQRVFVLLHGLSNGPVQFNKLTPLLFDRGANVIIARTPYHGEKDRMATEWGELTAQEMLDSANQAVDIARGLGRQVVVVGLSVNGTTAAWIAQNRSDVYRAVLLAPFLSPALLPDWSIRPASRLLGALPNFFIWWDPRVKENLPGPTYVYPRFPTRLIAQVMTLGLEVTSRAARTPARCQSILVVTSASDIAASYGPTMELVSRWRKLRPDAVETYRFPADEKVPHDFIDPRQPDQKVALVYPKLLSLLEN